MRTIVFLFSIIMMLFVSSCKEPFTCFEIVSHPSATDTINVGETVRFSGSCSEDAREFFWDFGNDRVGYGEEVSTVYDSIGDYNVSLGTVLGKATSTKYKTITVYP